MEPTPPGSHPLTLTLEDEQATKKLAADLAEALEPGDVVTLSGDLGAGKTTLARAIIRHLAGDDTLDVPSPTFTLVQSYDLPRFTLVHADLYRVSDPDELVELGVEDMLAGNVVLIEWPDRAPDLLPDDRLDVSISLAPAAGEDARTVRLTGFGAFATRAERIPKLRRFLEAAGWAEAMRQRIVGDASSRAYERLTHPDGRIVLLMNAPRRPDGPPIRYGRSYSAIAHLAEDVKPFVALANGLRDLGLSAPAIHAADLDNGFLLVEDLGSEPVVEGDPPDPEPECYRAAVDVLVTLHGHTLPSELPVTPYIVHRLPSYDISAFLIEIELLLEWYLPRLAAVPTMPARQVFLSCWREALAPVLAEPQTWVLRDYHSPNLIWLPERRGIAKVGLIDFQDALMGPAAYDLASLLQDARVTVPEDLELELIGRYARARRKVDPSFDVGRFAQIYATLAAQRATKILGIFARLDMRDGKPQYLRHMPRVATYLQRALAHPALAPLKAWYAAYVPPPPAPRD